MQSQTKQTRVLITILAISLVANAVLGISLYRVLQSRRGRPLPRQKPVFIVVERELQSVMAEPAFAEILEFGRFEAKEWICAVVILHKVDDIRPHWDKIVQIVSRVSKTCEIPGRPSGWQFDPDDPQRMTGTILQFGYSPEVGYRHPNEFYEELKN